MPTKIQTFATPGQRAQHYFAIAAPIGLLPWVPATFASAATAAFCWWLTPGHFYVALLTAALFLAGALAASTSERLQQIEDPRNVVIDEVAGQLLTFLFVPATGWRLALAGFILFRLFDILKPPPVNVAERLPRGWGIMADDILAGLYAAAALYAAHRWLPL